MQIELVEQRRVRASPHAAFALALDAERFPALFRGFGLIPGIRRITHHSPAAVGATRSLENEDGTQLREVITALDAPHRHAYTLSGMRPPFAWLVRAGHADWTFTADDAGCLVCWSYRFELASAWSWPLAGLLLRIFMRGAMRRCLAALAAALEPPPATV